jgi:hypothetical protein
MFKYFRIASLIVVSIFIASPVYAGTLSCTVTTAAACTGGTNTIILRMSGSTNAHAELPSGTNYTSSVVCCSGITGLGNSCSTGVTSSVLWLAGATNAHSSQAQTNANYNSDACISVPTGGTISVGYQASNCTGYDTTIGSMSDVTNAHIGDGTAYTTKICASGGVVLNPVPTTTSISPTSKNIGDSGFTLTVNGTNFISSSVINFNGGARTTTYVSATQLTTSILTSDLTTAGSFNITVTNGTPGGGTSNIQTFVVHNSIPNITSITPSSVLVGATQFTMTVNGINFVSNSQVKFGGLSRTTTFMSSTQLLAVILSGDLVSAGTFGITVYNGTTGETSGSQQFTVGSLGRREFNYSKTFYGSASLRK